MIKNGCSVNKNGFGSRMGLQLIEYIKHESIKSKIQIVTLLIFCFGLPSSQNIDGISTNQENNPCINVKLPIKQDIAARNIFVFAENLSNA